MYHLAHTRAYKNSSNPRRSNPRDRVEEFSRSPSSPWIRHRVDCRIPPPRLRPVLLRQPTPRASTPRRTRPKTEGLSFAELRKLPPLTTHAISAESPKYHTCPQLSAARPRRSRPPLCQQQAY